MWGGPKLMRPSRFFREVPSSYLKNYSPTTYEPQSRFTGGDGPGFAPGDRVHHKEFGNGQVQKVYQTSLGLTYEVAFEEPKMTRSLVAKFAKLQLCQ
jgi:DNA helicase-2/ATP-dependent DNA helicase PcrA